MALHKSNLAIQIVGTIYTIVKNITIQDLLNEVKDILETIKLLIVVTLPRLQLKVY